MGPDIERVGDAPQTHLADADNFTSDARMTTKEETSSSSSSTRTAKEKRPTTKEETTTSNSTSEHEPEATSESGIIADQHVPEASRLVQKPTPALEKFLSYHILREAAHLTDELKYRALKEESRRAALEVEIKKAEIAALEAKIKQAEIKVEGPNASVAKATSPRKERGV